MTLRDKIKGMILGGAIGDALGMPVESWDSNKICEMYPHGINTYVPPIGHKYFTPEEMPPGSITDDTQLTVATIKGLIAAKTKGKFDTESVMNEIADAHVVAMKESTAGWGKTTKEAVRRLANGCSWRESGKTDAKARGTGNGVAMKCSPLGVIMGITNIDCSIEFSAMTHYSKMSAISCIIHVANCGYCLWCSPKDFSPLWFARTDYVISDNCGLYNMKELQHLEDSEDSLLDRSNLLQNKLNEIKSMSRDDIFSNFGCGNSYLYEGLIFSYAHFLRNPFGASTIIDVIESGGDTDTNAKLVGELIGALNGIQIFESKENSWMLEGLLVRDELYNLAEQFCDVFEIN